MRTHLNPGKAAFEEAIKSEIFVDKTEMICRLNSVIGTKQKYVSVSRPRRFGKTMAVNMLCAYYGRGADSRELFEGMLVAKSRVGRDDWDEYLGQFDVIRIVMTRYIKESVSVAEGIAKMQRLVGREMRRAYPDVDYFDDADLIQTMDDVCSQHDTQFVVVIDEWDAVFRACQANKAAQQQYLDFLRDFMKDNTNIALAYITGILPIKKYGQHSALNMFTEYSMMAPRQLAPYTGFTEEEVMALCGKYNMDFEDVSNWYDGYRVSDWIPLGKRAAYRRGEYQGNRISIYSPLSVVECMTTGRIQNYWNKTETYEALAEYIKQDYDGLRAAVALLMDGGRLRIDVSTYQNDMTTFGGRDDVLSLLVHLGYLGYDDETSEVFVPNKEVLDEFKTSTKTPDWLGTFEAFEDSKKLLKTTWAEDAQRVAELIEKAHDRAANNTYNSEAALSYGIQLAYYAAQKYYTTILELDSGKGYANIAYLPSPRYPGKPALLVELKYNHDVCTALDQIRHRRYPDRLEHYRGNILLVAVSYDRNSRSNDPAFKHRSCVIERA